MNKNLDHLKECSKYETCTRRTDWLKTNFDAILVVWKNQAIYLTFPENVDGMCYTIIFNKLVW